MTPTPYSTPIGWKRHGPNYGIEHWSVFERARYRTSCRLNQRRDAKWWRLAYVLDRRPAAQRIKLDWRRRSLHRGYKTW